MSDLDFIKDLTLRKTLEDSIEYIYALYNESKDTTQKELYRVETYRVIILYVISAIEAVLLYYFKVRGEKIEYTNYVEVSQVSKNYTNKVKPDLPVVIAIQEMASKKEYEIGMNDLVKYYKHLKIIKEETAAEILSLNDVRNTFHFSKTRSKDCDLERVETALKMLVYVLDKAPRALETKTLAN